MVNIMKVVKENGSPASQLNTLLADSEMKKEKAGRLLTERLMKYKLYFVVTRQGSGGSFKDSRADASICAE